MRWTSWVVLLSSTACTTETLDLTAERVTVPCRGERLVFDDSTAPHALAIPEACNGLHVKMWGGGGSTPGHTGLAGGGGGASIIQRGDTILALAD